MLRSGCLPPLLPSSLVAQYRLPDRHRLAHGRGPMLIPPRHCLVAVTHSAHGDGLRDTRHLSIRWPSERGGLRRGAPPGRPLHAVQGKYNCSPRRSKGGSFLPFALARTRSSRYGLSVGYCARAVLRLRVAEEHLAAELSLDPCRQTPTPRRAIEVHAGACVHLLNFPADAAEAERFNDGEWYDIRTQTTIALRWLRVIGLALDVNGKKAADEAGVVDPDAESLISCPDRVQAALCEKTA